jgi:hypothetical protein
MKKSKMGKSFELPAYRSCNGLESRSESPMLSEGHVFPRWINQILSENHGSKLASIG